MIYNGPSIYNQGGAGGGYKDGGALVDADFIEVENNSISSYDNVSRDPINLYFEPKDGEILNSVVELTTAVNSTVNVYVLKNGFYYPLTVVGSSSITAGETYQINIDINTYSISQINHNDNYPEYAVINGHIIKTYLSDSKTRLFTEQIGYSSNTWGQYYYNSIQANEFVNQAGNGWKLINPNGQERTDFYNSSIPLLNLGYYDKNYGPQYTNRAVILFTDIVGYLYNSNSNAPDGSVSLNVQNSYPTFVMYKNL